MITTPFNAFLSENNRYGEAESLPVFSRFVTGFQFGYSAPNTATQNVPSSGLYSILNGLWTFGAAYQGFASAINDPVYTTIAKLNFASFSFGKDFYPVVDVEPSTSQQTLMWVIRNPIPLINALNVLHNTIAGRLFLISPNNVAFSSSGALNNATKNNFYSIYNKYRSVNFVNCLTDNQANEILFDSEYNFNLYKGNGIAHLFVLSGQDDVNWGLSRAGVELKCLIDYLLYGGIAVIAPTWQALQRYHNTSINIPAPVNALISNSLATQAERNAFSTQQTTFLTDKLDCVVSLEQGGLIERRTSESGYGADGTNRAAYASQRYTFPNTTLGNSYAIAYGLTSSQLINDHNPPLLKGSFVKAFLDNNHSYENIPVIHCGFSGTDIGIAQDPNSINSIFRYAGLNGLQGLRPESNAPSSGLTSYRFVDSDETSPINRTLCIFGKNTKLIEDLEFGPGNKQYLLAEIPAVADVAGIIAVNKMFGSDASEVGIYTPPVGPNNGAILNGIISPTEPFSRSNPDAVHLYNNRIAFFDFNYIIGGGGGVTTFLTNDFTGATSPDETNLDRDRLTVNWMVRGMAAEIRAYLTRMSDGTKINNADTRESVRTEVTNIVNRYGRFLSQATVQCDGNNNTNQSSLLVVDVALTPKRTIVDYSGPTDQFIGGYKLTFTISTLPAI